MPLPAILLGAAVFAAYGAIKASASRDDKVGKQLRFMGRSMKNQAEYKLRTQARKLRAEGREREADFLERKADTIKPRKT